MRRDEALRILRGHRAELAAMHVASLRLFGSVARDEARPDSDVDLLVTFSAPVDLFHFGDVQQRLEKALGCPVDLGTEDSVRSALRERILCEAIAVFPNNTEGVAPGRLNGVREPRSSYDDGGEQQPSRTREWKLYIEDVLLSIERIQRYASGKTYVEFEQDQMCIDAVLRNFAIIGEAMSRVPAEIRDAHREFPWSAMRGMRNVIVHSYVEIKLSIVWQTATEDLQPIVPLLEAMLRQ